METMLVFGRISIETFAYFRYRDEPTRCWNKFSRREICEICRPVPRGYRITDPMQLLGCQSSMVLEGWCVGLSASRSCWDSIVRQVVDFWKTVPLSDRMEYDECGGRFDCADVAADAMFLASYFDLICTCLRVDLLSIIFLLCFLLFILSFCSSRTGTDYWFQYFPQVLGDAFEIPSVSRAIVTLRTIFGAFSFFIPDIMSGQAEVLGTWIKLIELLHCIDDYLGRMLCKIEYIH